MKQSLQNISLTLRADKTYLFTSDTSKVVMSLLTCLELNLKDFVRNVLFNIEK